MLSYRQLKRRNRLFKHSLHTIELDAVAGAPSKQTEVLLRRRKLGAWNKGMRFTLVGAAPDEDDGESGESDASDADDGAQSSGVDADEEPGTHKNNTAVLGGLNCLVSLYLFLRES